MPWPAARLPGHISIAAQRLAITAVSLQSATALVTGTLGLAFPTTAKAMHHAVDAATSSPCCVLVDVNWRPVFWAGQEDVAQVGDCMATQCLQLCHCSRPLGLHLGPQDLVTCLVGRSGDHC